MFFISIFSINSQQDKVSDKYLQLDNNYFNKTTYVYEGDFIKAKQFKKIKTTKGNIKIVDSLTIQITDKKIEILI